jgi:hypothetical protein
LIAQETTAIPAHTNTKIVMKLFEAETQLEIPSPTSMSASAVPQLAIVSTKPRQAVVPNIVSCLKDPVLLTLRATFTATNCPADTPACAAIALTVDDVLAGSVTTNRPLQSLTFTADWQDLNQLTTIIPPAEPRERPVTIVGEQLGTAVITATVEDKQVPAEITFIDCPTPSLFAAIAGVAVPEGDGGSRDIILTATLSAPPETGTVSVDFETVDGGATANEDYLTTKGRLTFGKNDTEKQIPITIIGDRTLEPDERFRVRFSNPQPPELALVFSEVEITLLNDDATILAKGVGLRNAAITDKGTIEGSITLHIPAASATNELRAFLTWQSVEQPLDNAITLMNTQMEQTLTIPGTLTQDVNSHCLFTEIPNFKELILPGSANTLTLSLNGNQAYSGAGMAVITHVLDAEVSTGAPQNSRMGTIARLNIGSEALPLGIVEVQAGCDFFHHSSVGNENSEAATFLFDPNTGDQARIVAFVGDAQSNNAPRGSELLFLSDTIASLSDTSNFPVDFDLARECAQRRTQPGTPLDASRCIGLGGPHTLMRVLDAIDGAFWDTFGRNSGLSPESSAEANDPDLRGIFAVPPDAEFASFQLLSPTDNQGVSATLSMVIFHVSAE